MLPATAKKLVMVHMWLRIETMKESGKWEADLLQHTDEDLTWELRVTLRKVCKVILPLLNVKYM